MRMPYKESWGEKAKERSRKRTQYFIEYRKKAKEKYRARARVGQALKDGRLEKGVCEFYRSSQCKGRIEGHHPDYKKPLQIYWLCSKHHREEHNKIEKLKKEEKNCQNCGAKIEPPRKKYCSSRCNLAGWRKEK